MDLEFRPPITSSPISCFLLIVLSTLLIAIVICRLFFSFCLLITFVHRYSVAQNAQVSMIENGYTLKAACGEKEVAESDLKFFKVIA